MVAAVIIVCGGIVGCEDDDGGLVHGTGTIVWLSFEGGFYGIVADDDEHYDPINLPQDFHEDGLRVWFMAKIRDDLASFHMWGRIVEILEIEKL